MSNFRAPLGLVLLLIVFAGCATVPKGVSNSNPALYLERDAQAYIRLSGTAARDIAVTLGPERMDKLFATVVATANRTVNGAAKGDKAAGAAVLDQKTLEMVLKRTNSAAIGLSALDTDKPFFESVFLGEFPSGSLPLAMVMSSDWSREPGGYIHKSGEFHLRSPSAGVLRLNSFPDSPRPAGSPAAKTVPARFADRAMSDILMWMEKPREVFGRSIFGEAFDLPVSGMLFSAVRTSPSGAAEAGYLTDVVFVMESEATARTYRPIMRFLWSAMADRLFGAGTGAANALNMEGDLYTVRGMWLSLDALTSALAPTDASQPL